MEPFRTFKEPNGAEHLAEWLSQEGLSVVTKAVEPMMNAPFLATRFARDYQIYLPASEFRKAEDLMKRYYKEQIDSLPDDYYLYAFSDKELYDILAQPDMWGELDFELARKLLEERGLEHSEAQIDGLREQRITELKRPEKAAYGEWLMAVLALLTGVVLTLRGSRIPLATLTGPALFTTFIGWHLSSGTRTLPDGQKAFIYTVRDRKMGYWLRIAGMAGVVLGIVLMLLQGFAMSHID